MGQIYTIGDYVVEPLLDEIRRAGITTRIEPRAMRVLIHLAKQPGEVVSVQDLLDEVWKDVVVTQDSVYTAIASLRRALHDDGLAHRYIVNVPRRGYRLVAAVSVAVAAPLGRSISTEAVEPASGDSAAVDSPAQLVNDDGRTSNPLGTRRWWVTTAVVVAVAAILVAAFFSHTHTGDARTAQVGGADAAAGPIAVMPFRVGTGGDGADGALADAVSDEVGLLLSKFPQLNVVGRSEIRQAARASDDPRQVARALGAAYVVEGQLQRAGGAFRIAARLVETEGRTDVWSDTVECRCADTATAQDQLAAQIAHNVEIMVMASAANRPESAARSRAYALYLRALSKYNLARPDSLAEVQAYLEHAIDADGSFTRARETLAVIHVAQATEDSIVARYAFEHAEAAARGALMQNAASSTAHAVLGLVRALHDFDWDTAEHEFKVALAQDPSNAVALDYAARVAHARGLTDEALRRIGASLAVDGLDPYALQTLGQIQFAKGDLKAAQQTFLKLANVSPAWDGNHGYLAAIASAGGDQELALREAAQEPSVDAQAVAYIIVYSATGQRAMALERLSFIESYSRDIWPVGLALAHAHLGNIDKAFDWLERARESRDPELLMEIRSDYLVGPLRANPRYRKLLASLNLTS